MSKISDLAARGIYYQPLATTPEQVPEESGDFMRGLKKAGYQIPQTLGGTAALVGDLVGADGLREYGLGVYEKNQAKIEGVTKDSDSLSNVLEGDASGIDWAQNAAGYVTGQAATAIATGGVGGFIGSQLAKRGIREVIARGAESEIAKQVAKNVASRGAKIGVISALGASNLSQEAGSIYPEALHQAELDGRTLDGGDKARVVGSAIAAAAVDTGMDMFIGGKMLASGRKAGEGIGRAALREIPGMAAKEAATEGIQTGIERYGAGQDLSSADAIRDYVDSMGVGAMGGGMGGGVAVLHSRKVADTGPLSRAANEGIDAEILQLTNDPEPLIAFPDGSVGTKADFEAYLKQFPEEDGQRNEARAKLLGLGPQEEKPEPLSAASAEEEKAAMTDWAAQHEPATHEYALNLLKAPGTKGQKLMVAPHPDGGGYTVVPSNFLTLDSQASYADLQKPPKAGDTKGKSDDAVPEKISDGAGSAATAVRPEKADGSGPGPVEQPLRGQSADDAGTGGKGHADPVRTDPAADAKPALTEAEADPDPYARNIFHSPTVAEAFIKRKAIDPAKFEVVPTGEGRWGVKPRAPAAVELDAAAHEAATSPHNDLPEPTQAQKEAGNYKVGKVKLHGLDISIENPAGSVRKGVDKSGKPWENTLAHHYGYIKKTLGADGDHVDAFIGPDPESERIYVVDQVEPESGKFDEQKVVMGAHSADEARAIYQANYAKGWKGAKDVTETSVEGFKTWLNDGDTTKPFAPQVKENTDVQENHVPTVERDAADGQAASSADSGGNRSATAAGTAPADAAAGPGVPASDVQEAPDAAPRVKKSRAGKADAAPPVAAVIPSSNDIRAETVDQSQDDGSDIPLTFYRKVKVQQDAWDDQKQAFEQDEFTAQEALTSVREDIDNLQALLKCMKG